MHSIAQQIQIIQIKLSSLGLGVLSGINLFSLGDSIQSLRTQITKLQQQVINEKDSILEPQIQQMKSQLEHLLLNEKLLLLQKIQRQTIPSSGGGDCPFNTLALSFVAEIVSPQGALYAMSNEQGNEQYNELLESFGEFHKKFKNKTWSNFKEWINHYNTPREIELMLAPVFRKYYANKILPKHCKAPIFRTVYNWNLPS